MVTNVQLQCCNLHAQFCMAHTLLFYILISLPFFCASQKLALLPFEQLYGGVIIVKATLDAKPNDTLNFVLDTGSSHISLDSTTVSNLGLVAVPSSNEIRGIGGLKKVSQCLNQTLTIAGLKLTNIAFNVNDYTIIAESSGVHIDGILGFAFISKYILEVNYDSSVITIHGLNPIKYPRRGYTLPFTLNYLPKLTLKVSEQKKHTIPLYIDCGAGISMLYSEKMVSDSAFFAKGKKKLTVLIEGMGGITSTQLTTTKVVNIGPYKFKQVPTYVYNDKHDVLRYPYSSGLLGNDILRRFNWILNYNTQELHLMPNSNYYENFDYSYTGLSIYYKDKAIIVVDIADSSPAQLAGFEIGDIIIGINKTFVTTLKQAKDLLQTTNRNLQVIILRNNAPQNITLRPLSIR